jgi:hypothetical protein
MKPSTYWKTSPSWISGRVVNEECGKGDADIIVGAFIEGGQEVRIVQEDYLFMEGVGSLLL